MRRIGAAVVLTCLVTGGLVSTAPTQASSPGESENSTASDGADTPPPCSDLQAAASGEELASRLRADGGVFETLLAKPEAYRVQVLTREVVERNDAADCLIRRDYRADAEYFYPASAIKTVAAVGAMQFLAKWNRRGREPELGLESRLWYRRPVNFDALETTDFDWEGGLRLRTIVRNTLVVSSNEGFNRLFDLVGHARLNRWMWRAGLESLRMKHRMFSRRTPEEQKWSPRVAVQVGETDDGEPEREVVRPERRSDLEFPETPADRLKVGETHTSFLTGEYHERPMDFSGKNYISLDDLQRLMVELYRPDLLEEVDFGDLGEYRSFLKRTLGRHPEADSDEKRRSLLRRFSPMRPGVVEVLGRERIAYQNKAGRAYGFHLDNARIVDQKTGREIYVAAAVYVNRDGEVNDNDYGYESKSYPFLRGVGRVAAQYLLSEE